MGIGDVFVKLLLLHTLSKFSMSHSSWD